ncbi:MAG: hypothetical protein ACFE85_18685 [Candidatus Hodarchaeota archaeon]
MTNINKVDDSDIYRKLQEHLDQMPIGFPRAESGSYKQRINYKVKK